MKIVFSIFNHWRCKQWFLILPTIGIGYCRKFLHITLYILAWEFSVEFNWEEQV